MSLCTVPQCSDVTEHYICVVVVLLNCSTVLNELTGFANTVIGTLGGLCFYFASQAAIVYFISCFAATSSKMFKKNQN